MTFNQDLSSLFVISLTNMSGICAFDFFFFPEVNIILILKNNTREIKRIETIIIRKHKFIK